MLEINSYVEDFRRYEESEGRNIKKTVNKYISNINEFIDYMKVDTVEELNDMTWIEIKMNYINNIKKEKNLSSQSINLRITSLRAFFEYLVGMRILKENVCLKIKKEKCKAREVNVDIEDAKKILRTLDKNFEENPCFLTARNRVMIYLYMFTGMRNNELINMKITDINVKGEFIVKGKYNKERLCCIPNKLKDMYFDYVLNYRTEIKDSEWVFPTYRGNKANQNTSMDVFKKILKQANLDPSMRIHDLRHLAATLLLESGNTLDEVSAVLGHCNSVITSSIYVNTTKDTKIKTINNNKLLDII